MYNGFMWNGIILGTIQGIAEWLPISSEGMVALFGVNFLGWTNLEEIIQYAIFLHIGTFFSALIYFRKDVLKIFESLKKENRVEDDFKIFKFLFISTLITGVIGFAILYLIKNLDDLVFGKYLNILIGLALIVTGLIQIKRVNFIPRLVDSLKMKDAIWLGVLQSFSILPGLSRSGLTIAGFLFRKFEEETAIRLSFLMSLPVVLGANIVLNLNNFVLDKTSIIAVVFSFVFGLLTIHLLLKFAKEVNWPKFVIVFGVLAILATFM